MTTQEILDIARRWLRKPPSPREYSTGALQDEVAAVMHFAKERAQAEIEAAAEQQAEDEAYSRNHVPPGGIVHGVFTNCNVCGRQLHYPGEDQMGMCFNCAGEECPT